MAILSLVFAFVFSPVGIVFGRQLRHHHLTRRLGTELAGEAPSG